MLKTKPRMLFVWEKFGPYHMDRCEALARHFGSSREVIGVEIASFGEVYRWDPTGPGRHFQKITLFPGRAREEISQFRYLAALLSTCISSRARHIFLCGFEIPSIFLTAVILRLLGRYVVVMQDSKFDDKPRALAKEWLKSLLYGPYHAALVGSPRSRAYLQFLGFPPGRIFLGYDVVSLDRIIRLARAEPAPGGVSHSDRHFTIIARFVPAKNLQFALESYRVYRQNHPTTPRDLHLCGSGALEGELRDLVARLRLEGVHFRGYLQEQDIAKTLASTLGLILPSIEEPFGLVVNEALAMGVPVVVSENCGARDLLVRQAVNGYIIEPDNTAGLAHLMMVLDRDRLEWMRLATNARAFRGEADVARFTHAVDEILDSLSGCQAQFQGERPSVQAERCTAENGDSKPGVHKRIEPSDLVH
jgi:L-malate glycosyltransferase